MRGSIGPYRVGEQVYACSRWALLDGVDSRDGSTVWVRRTHPGPRRGAAARALLGELAECEFIARPVALASDEGALVAIDRIEPGWGVLARSGRVDGDAQVRAAHGLATAVDVLHAAGYAHGGIGEWTIDLTPAGELRLRGAAEAVGELDRAGARRDICAVVAAIERIGGDAADPRIAATLTALSAGRAGLAELIAVTAKILGIEPPVAWRAEAPPAGRRPHGAVAGVRPTSGGRPHVDGRHTHDVVSGLRGGPRPALRQLREPRQHRDPREVRQRGESREARLWLRASSASAQPRRAPRHAAPAGHDRRGLVAMGMLVVGIALAIVAIWPREGPPTAAATAVAPGLSEDRSTEGTANPSWATYLPALYDTRAEAFSAGDQDLLAQVYTPGSPQLRADAETIAALQSQQREVHGFAPTIIEVYDVQIAGNAATVLVRDEIAPFVIVDAAGSEMPVDGRAAAMTTLTLQEIDGAWLIDTAQRAPE